MIMRVFFLLALLSLSLSCEKRSVGPQSDAVKLPVGDVFVYVPTTLPDGVNATASVNLVNQAPDTVKITQVGMSCHCLSYKGPLPVVIPGGTTQTLKIEIEPDANLARRGGRAIFKFEDGSSSMVKLTLLRGTSLELAPAVAKIHQIASERFEYRHMGRYYGPTDGGLSFASQPSQGENVQGYSLVTRMVEDRGNFALVEFVHKFESGVPPGLNQYQMNVSLGGRGMASIRIQATGCSADHIDPAMVILKKEGPEQGAYADLIVPWVDRQKLKSAFVGSHPVENFTFLPEGCLRLQVPAKALAGGRFDIADGRLVLQDGKSAPFHLVWSPLIVTQETKS